MFQVLSLTGLESAIVDKGVNKQSAELGLIPVNTSAA